MIHVVRKTLIFCGAIVYIKTIVLPRQGRDKHRETTQKRDAFLSAGSLHLTLTPKTQRYRVPNRTPPFLRAMFSCKTYGRLSRQARDKYQDEISRPKNACVFLLAGRRPAGRGARAATDVPAPANISVKRLKLRLSGSARKSQKTVPRDTPRFKFPAVLARVQPFQRSNGRLEWGDHPV